MNQPTTPPVYAAFDYSYTSPAIAIWDSSKPFTAENIFFYALTKTKKYQGLFGNVRISQYPDNALSDVERFYAMSAWSENVMAQHGVTHARIEEYAYGKGGNSKSQAGRAFQLAENTGMLKYVLYVNQVPFDSVSPTHVKKYFTGKGQFRGENGKKLSDREKKLPMILEAYERLGIKIHEQIGADAEHIKPVDDICDAFAILCTMEGVPAQAKVLPKPPKGKKK